MKHNTVLIVLSLLNALFFAPHLTGDIVVGIETGGRDILVRAGNLEPPTAPACFRLMSLFAPAGIRTRDDGPTAGHCNRVTLRAIV